MSTNTITQIDKQSILSDPVAAFTAIHDSSPPDILEQIKEHHVQINNLLHQANETQRQSKTLSRQIGEAKREGLDFEELKMSMQKLSKLQKDVSLRIYVHEQAILDHFNHETPPIHKELANDAADTSGRTSRDLNDDITSNDDIVITLLTDQHLEWNDYVEKNQGACIHHRSEWKAILEESYGHECFYYIAYDKQNSVVGILPLVHLQSRLFGNLLVSMPYFQRAGAIADNPLIEEKLLQLANHNANRNNIEHIEYRDDIPRDTMPAQTHKVNMVLDLPINKKLLWQGFSSKLRAQIRRPQRENPTTIIGNLEILDDFYSVYARNMRDLGSPLHSKKFIKNILEHFPENSWLVVIKLNGRAVSSGFLLADKHTMEIPLASTIRDVNPLSINMLLYWQVLKFSIKHGYKYFDFGRSTEGAGTYRFKKQWGAKAKPLYWHYWLNNNTSMPGLNPANPKFSLAIYLWKKLPISLSKLLGPLIVKNIP